MNTLKTFTLQTARLLNHIEINKQLLDGLNLYINDNSTRKSHEFFGRYENIYIDCEKIPALHQVLEAVKNLAADILNVSTYELKAGLWFNVMNPGDRTTLHKHDDDDELLSAVYYVSTPKNSGKLLLNKSVIHTEVTPQEGMFVFFPPNMPHEVTENMSDQCRVSLGINIGPANSDNCDHM